MRRCTGSVYTVVQIQPSRKHDHADDTSPARQQRIRSCRSGIYSTTVILPVPKDPDRHHAVGMEDLSDVV